MSRFGLSLLLAVILSASTPLMAIDQPQANTFAGQDLHLSALELFVSQPGPERNILIFDKNFEMSVGANSFSADSAVVWLQANTLNYQGRLRTEYFAQVYLSGDVSVRQGKKSKTTDITTSVARGRSLIARFVVTGDVFITAEQRKTGDPNSMRIFQQAVEALSPVQYEPFAAIGNEPNEFEAAEPNAFEPNAPAAKPEEQNALPSNVGFKEPYNNEYLFPEAVVPTFRKEMLASGPPRPSLIEEFFTPAGKILPGESKPGV
jgi:hypothetical protein